MLALQHSNLSLQDAIKPLNNMHELKEVDLAFRLRAGMAAKCASALWKTLDGPFTLQHLGLVLAHNGKGAISELGDKEQAKLSKILSNHQNEINFLKLAFSGFLSKDVIKVLPGLPNLTNLTLSKLADIQHTCEHVSQCTRLQSLSLYFVTQHLQSTGLAAYIFIKKQFQICQRKALNFLTSKIQIPL